MVKAPPADVPAEADLAVKHFRFESTRWSRSVRRRPRRCAARTSGSPSRGQVLDGGAYRFLATAHPSAVMRADDRDEAYALLVADLKVAAAELG